MFLLLSRGNGLENLFKLLFACPADGRGYKGRGGGGGVLQFMERSEGSAYVRWQERAIAFHGIPPLQGTTPSQNQGAMIQAADPLSLRPS